MLRAWMFALCALLLPAATAAQDFSYIRVDGTWNCLWIDPSRGYIYECSMTLVQTKSNSIEGNIAWTLVRSPKPEDTERLGTGAVEFVRGVMDPKTGRINFKGYDKEDPVGVIGLDDYKLEVSESGTWMFGPTATNGAGTGRFTAFRRFW
ncbi:MAG: hypothetical protein AB7N54_07010 [Alphaproteobacteria bacterium]